MSKNQLHPVQECYLAGIQNKPFSVKEKRLGRIQSGIKKVGKKESKKS